VHWVPVKSRMLAAAAYNHDWQQLYLQQLYLKYRSCDVYCYRGVPVEQYQGLLAADSKGKYVRTHILNRYPYQRIHSPQCPPRADLFREEIGSSEILSKAIAGSGAGRCPAAGGERSDLGDLATRDARQDVE